MPAHRIELSGTLLDFHRRADDAGTAPRVRATGQSGLEVMRRYGIESALLVSNQIEALVAIGNWDERNGSAPLRSTALRRASRTCCSSSAPTSRSAAASSTRARAHLEAAGANLRKDRLLGLYDAHNADLALWERRWTDADGAIGDGLKDARPREAAQIRVQLCAKGLRAHAELAALARARRDVDALEGWLDRARKLIGVGRCAAPRPRRSRQTHPAGSPWPRPSTSAPADPHGPSRGRRRQQRGAARTPAPRRLLPLARGRSARRRRRLPQ